MPPLPLAFSRLGLLRDLSKGLPYAPPHPRPGTGRILVRFFTLPCLPLASAPVPYLKCNYALWNGTRMNSPPALRLSWQPPQHVPDSGSRMSLGLSMKERRKQCLARER